MKTRGRRERDNGVMCRFCGKRKPVSEMHVRKGLDICEDCRANPDAQPIETGEPEKRPYNRTGLDLKDPEARRRYHRERYEAKVGRKARKTAQHATIEPGKEAEHQREYQREYKRKQRAQQPGAPTQGSMGRLFKKALREAQKEREGGGDA